MSDGSKKIDKPPPETEVERREKTPTPKISALLRKRPGLLRANFVLTKDRKRPYYGHFVVKYTGRGLVVKRPGVLSKVQMLNLVLGVGVFSLLPKKGKKGSEKILGRVVEKG